MSAKIRYTRRTLLHTVSYITITLTNYILSNHLSKKLTFSQQHSGEMLESSTNHHPNPTFFRFALPDDGIAPVAQMLYEPGVMYLAYKHP